MGRVCRTWPTGEDHVSPDMPANIWQSFELRGPQRLPPGQKTLGLIPELALKGGETYRGARQSGMCIFCPHDILALEQRVHGCQAVKGGFQVFAQPLCLTIGLWVEPWEKADCGPDQLALCLPELKGELGTPGRQHIQWEAKNPQNMVAHSLVIPSIRL